MAEVKKSITLVYNTSVYVEIDLSDPAEPDVWKVVVGDEAIEYDEAATWSYNLDGPLAKGLRLSEVDAIKAQIATLREWVDDENWPRWSFG